MIQSVLCVVTLGFVYGIPAPYARLIMRPANQLAATDGTSQKTNTGEAKRIDVSVTSRETLRLQNQRLSSLLSDGILNSEKAHRLSAMLFDDLGSPENNALWAQSMLQRLVAIASNADAPGDVQEIIRDGVLDYYNQQRAMHTSNEFVSPMCMWAMGNALRAVGDTPEAKADSEALRNGAIGWLKSLGYQSQADRLAEELTATHESDSDVTSELLRTYARLLVATPEPTRMELSRMQSIMRNLVEREKIASREQWDLWTRAMIKLGKRADTTTQSFIRDKLKAESNPDKLKYFKSVAKRLEIRDQLER